MVFEESGRHMVVNHSLIETFFRLSTVSSFMCFFQLCVLVQLLMARREFTRYFRILVSGGEETMGTMAQNSESMPLRPMGTTTTTTTTNNETGSFHSPTHQRTLMVWTTLCMLSSSPTLFHHQQEQLLYSSPVGRCAKTKIPSKKKNAGFLTRSDLGQIQRFWSGTRLHLWRWVRVIHQALSYCQKWSGTLEICCWVWHTRWIVWKYCSFFLSC